MNFTESHRYEMLVRVRDFGSEHAALFPSTTVGARMFAAVASAVDALSTQAATQVVGRGAAREGVSSKALGRRALRAMLEKISHTARGMAVDTPGLEATFQLPDRLSDQGLLATARAFSNEATPLAPAFVAHEMPANFLVTLTTDIEAFETAIHDRAAGKGTHIAARAGIKAALDSGLAAVRKLDAIMPNKLEGDPVTLAAWQSARHVEQRPGSKHAARAAHTATAGTPATAAAPANTAAAPATATPPMTTTPATTTATPTHGSNE